MTAHGKPLAEFSHATLGEFLRLKGYEIPHSISKENIIHGIRAWSEQRKPTEEEKMLPQVTPRVFHTWASETHYIRSDEERVNLQKQVRNLQLKMAELEHTMKKMSPKNPTGNETENGEIIIGMYNAGNDCWLIVAIRAIQMMYNDVFEKGDPDSSYISTLFKETDYLTDVVNTWLGVFV